MRVRRAVPALIAAFLSGAATPATPVITRQPATIVDERGEISSLSAEASGQGELKYQWRYFSEFSDQPGSPISNATNAVFTPPEAPWPSSGFVAVEVTDANGSTISEPAKVDWVQRSAVSELSRWPGILMGEARGSAIRGDLAYVAAGALQVFDISNPRLPVRIGAANDPDLERGYENDRIYDRSAVQVEGSIACAIGVSGLVVYDLSNPTVPVSISSIWVGGGGDTPHLNLKDGYAYLCNGDLGAIFDLRNPREPRLASRFIFPTNSSHFRPLMSAAHENTLYVAETDALASGETSSLRIFDIRDRAEPRLIERRVGTTYGVAVDSGKLYVVGDGLQVMDLSEPQAPRLIGEIRTERLNRLEVLNLTVRAGMAYLSYGTNGLRLFDARDPANPKPAGQLQNGGTAYDIQVSGEVGYWSNGENGWQVVDLPDPARPSLIANTDASGMFVDLVVTNNLVLAAAMSSGLQVFDVSVPEEPKPLANYRTVGEARSIAMRGNIVYLACGTGGLEWVNVANASTPVQTGTRRFGSERAEIVFAVDNQLVLATDARVYVFDITDPATLTGGGPYASVNPILSMVIRENKVVIDSWEAFRFPTETVQILDLSSDPPRIISQVNRLTPTHKLSDAASALTSPDALSPVQLRYLLPFGKSNQSFEPRMHLAGDLVLQFNSLASGLAVYDISTPSQPGLMDTGFEVSGVRSLRQMTTVSNRIYAAAGGAGLRIMEFESGPPRIPEGVSTSGFIWGGAVNALLKVEAKGARPMSYQWYNGEKGDTSEPLAGATLRTFAVNRLDGRVLGSPGLTATTWVRVSNEFGFVDSESETVGVLPILEMRGTKASPIVNWTSFGAGRWVLESSSTFADWQEAEEMSLEDPVTKMSEAHIQKARRQSFYRLRYIPEPRND